MPPIHHRSLTSLRRPVAVFLAIGSTAVLTVLATHYARSSEEAAAQRDLARLGAERTAAVRQSMASCMQALMSVRAFFAASEEVRADEFATFTAPLLKEHPGILLLGWAEELESPQGSSVPLRFATGVPRWRTLQGFDLATVQAWSEAIDVARATGATAAARTDPSDPAFAADHRWIFLEARDNSGSRAGYLAGLIDLGRVLESSLADLRLVPQGIDIYFLEEGEDAVCSTVYIRPSLTRPPNDPRIPGHMDVRAGMHYGEPFVLAARRWLLLCSPTPGFREQYLSWTSWAILAAGLTCTLVLAWSFATITRHSRQLEISNETLKEEIERRQQAEVELIASRNQAEAANRAKAQFLANMSHELRTPLNGVLGVSRLLLDTPLLPDQHEQVLTVQSSSEHLLALVNDVLDFAGLEARALRLNESEIDVRQVVEDAMQLVAQQAHGKGLELVHDIEPDVPSRVRGDSARLRQVLLNLLGNAIKFTTHGEVVLGVSMELDRQATAVLRFSVSDSGPGVPPEVLPELFKRFSQGNASMSRHQEGMGLGLAISKQLVQLMGGEIALENRAAGGCTAWFTARFEAIARAESPLLPLKHSARVLLVEDNETTRTILCRKLASYGLSVCAVPSGERALEELRSYLSEGTPPDLALIDVTLPGLDAASLTRHVRSDRRLAACRLLLMVPAGASDALTDGEGGVDAKLIKPWRESRLRSAVAGLLEPAGVLPCVRAQSNAPDQIHAGLRGKRVLIVEDNLVNQRVTLRILEKAGCKTDLAQNGREAVEVLSRSRYDAVLMDCQMPEMDGFEATAAIRRGEGKGTRLPIIALTAHSLPEDRARCVEVGMDDFLSKPVPPDDLLVALERAIGSVSTYAGA